MFTVDALPNVPPSCAGSIAELDLGRYADLLPRKEVGVCSVPVLFER